MARHNSFIRSLIHFFTGYPLGLKSGDGEVPKDPISLPQKLKKGKADGAILQRNFIFPEAKKRVPGPRPSGRRPRRDGETALPS